MSGAPAALAARSLYDDPYRAESELMEQVPAPSSYDSRGEQAALGRWTDEEVRSSGALARGSFLCRRAYRPTTHPLPPPNLQHAAFVRGLDDPEVGRDWRRLATLYVRESVRGVCCVRDYDR